MTHRHLFRLPTLRALAFVTILAPLGAGPALAGSDEAAALFGGAPLVEREILAAERAAEGVTITGDVGVNLADQRGTITGNAITAPTTNGALSSNRISENRV